MARKSKPGIVLEDEIQRTVEALRGRPGFTNLKDEDIREVVVRGITQTNRKIENTSNVSPFGEAQRRAQRTDAAVQAYNRRKKK